MSVSVLTNSTVPALLGDNVRFGTMVGGTLTLDLIVARELRVDTIKMGVDTIPDIYSFAQVPSEEIICTGLTGLPAADSGLQRSAKLSNFQYFGEPVYLNATTKKADALNPCIIASYTQQPIKATVAGTPTLPTVGDVPTTLATFIYPSVPLLTPALNSSNGAWFGLDGKGAVSVINFDNLIYSFYVAGCPPATAPAPWAIPVITPNQPAGITPTALTKPWTFAYPGGITGTAVTFPVASTPAQPTISPLGWLPLGGAAKPWLTYPVSGITPALPASPANGNSVNEIAVFNGTFDPLTSVKAAGIWVQQIWWFQNASQSTPAKAFNVTHLFTVPGANPADPVAGVYANTAPLNNITNFVISARATPTVDQAPDDGAFSISLEMPTRVIIATGVTAALPLPNQAFNPGTVQPWQYQWGATGATNNNNNLVAATNATLVGTSVGFNTTGNGQWAIFFATTNNDAVASTCRASNNQTTANGGGSSRYNLAGGVFTQYPSNANGSQVFPTTLVHAGNLGGGTFTLNTSGTTDVYPGNGSIPGAYFLPG